MLPSDNLTVLASCSVVDSDSGLLPTEVEVETGSGPPLVNETDETLTEVTPTLLLGVLKSSYVDDILVSGSFLVVTPEVEIELLSGDLLVLVPSAVVDSGWEGMLPTGVDVDSAGGPPLVNEVDEILMEVLPRLPLVGVVVT